MNSPTGSNPQSESMFLFIKGCCTPVKKNSMQGGKGPNSAFMGHCRWEIYHAQWSIILDNDFLKAYSHRMAVKCGDRIWCRFYLHIFTYSADYKEVSSHQIAAEVSRTWVHPRIIIVGIRNLGLCLCPQCLILMDHVSNMGMHQDLSQHVSLADMTIERLRLHLRFSHGLVNTMSIMFACCNLLVHLELMVWTATYGV